MTDRKRPKIAIYTTGCGFWTAPIYRQLRSVKNSFRYKRESGDFGRGRRVRGDVTDVHSRELAPRTGNHKAEQFTPELFWHSGSVLETHGPGAQTAHHSSVEFEHRRRDK